MSGSRLLPLGVAAMIAGWVVLAGAQTPRFVAGTDAILVDVLVTRSERVVEGLSAADFIVRDSGVEQKIQLVATGELPVSLLLVLDTSASVRGAALDHLKDAAHAAVAGLRPVDEVALMTFANNLLLRSGWTTNRDKIGKAIAGVSAGGSTALVDVAFAALLLKPKATTRTLVLFFTDGDDTASWLAADDLLETARQSNAVVYSVLLDTEGNAGAAISKSFGAADRTGERLRNELEGWVAAEPRLYRAALLPLLSAATGGETLRSQQTSALKTAFADILARFSRRYVLAFTPTGVPPTGWHPLEVEVRGGGEISARRGYSR